MDNNKKAPIFSESYTISGTKIIIIFSGIFVFMKFFAVISQGLWVIPNLLMTLPALLLGLGGLVLLKTKKTNWFFIIFALLVFLAVRLNEDVWVLVLQQQFIN